MPVATAIQAGLTRIRTAGYARLEQIRFRTGVLVLAGAAAIAACATAIAIMAAHGGPPAAVHRPLADRVRPAAKPVPVGPSRPAERPPRQRQPAPTAHHAGPAGATGTITTVSSITSSAPPPDHSWRRGRWRWVHRTGRDWWHHGHSPWHGHGPWPGRWHDGDGPHHAGTHRPGHGHW